MSLVLRNLQRTVSVRRSQLRRDIEIFRQILEVQQFDLGVICVDNRRVQRINNTYRQKDFPTDVLSFPFFEVTAAHGLCHLLGYRHSTEAEWKQMFKKESQILEEYNRLTGANLQPLTKNKF
nr:PREDICTED: putative ribonuclease isoform X2 [Latimeria chalumnae]|eukprot:XP_014344934.1 PREDICTED: putative ribonuclease isoform X2 [Latimeria chalumnae]